MATIDDVYNKVDALSTQVTSLRELVEGMNEVFSGHVVSILNKAESNRVEIVGDINQSKTDIFELVNSQSDLLREHVTSRCANTTNAVNGHVTQAKADIFEEMTTQIGTDAGGRTLHQHISEEGTQILGVAGSRFDDLGTTVTNAKSETIGVLNGSITGAKQETIGTLNTTVNNVVAGAQSALSNSISNKVESARGDILDRIDTSDGGVHSHINTVISNQVTQTSYIGEVETRVTAAVESVKAMIGEDPQERTLHAHIEESTSTLTGEVTGAKEDIEGKIGTHWDSSSQEQTLHQHIQSLSAQTQNMEQDVQANINTVYHKVEGVETAIGDKVDNAASAVSTNVNTVYHKLESVETVVGGKVDNVNNSVNQRANDLSRGLTEQIQYSVETVVGGKIDGVDDNVNRRIANLSRSLTEQIQSATTNIINAVTGIDPDMLLKTIQQSLDTVMRNEMIKDDTERALVGALVIALVRTQLGEKRFEELTNVLERVRYTPASAVEQGMMVGEPTDSPLSIYYQLFNSSKRKPTPSRLSPEFGDANQKE